MLSNYSFGADVHECVPACEVGASVESAPASVSSVMLQLCILRVLHWYLRTNMCLWRAGSVGQDDYW